MKHLCPASLRDLFGAFERLDQGMSVALYSEDRRGFDPKTEISLSKGSQHRQRVLGIWTSGSSGHPKLVWKPWRELKSGVPQVEQVHGWNWCSPFEPVSFAGVHVALHAWRNQGGVHSLSNDWAATWSTLTKSKAEALSCTPTFLDLLIQSEEERPNRWHPRQITLGGETIRPGLAERAEKRFLNTRFTVIYAAAEFGVFAKTQRLDGWYEVESLNRHCGKWQVQEGVLEVLVGSEWKSTGDRVEVVDGSFRVLGRADCVANIGGVKVNLADIGRLAETVSGVRRAVASMEPNPIVGQIVSLKFAVERNVEPSEVESRLQRHLREHLCKEAWPRRWVLDEVGLGNNSKGIIR